MRIAKLSKIKKHRIFRDLTWSADLPGFAQFNVIYGWNGCGKTTLSSLFEHLQEKRAVTEGEVEFELDSGNRIAGSDIPMANVPGVRVFNRNVVVRTIEAIGANNVTPIYFLGAESIAQQKQVENLKVELTAARDAVTTASNDKRSAERSLDDFCVEKAKLIKEALLGSALHATYDKRRFRGAIADLKGKSPTPNALSTDEKKVLRKQKELQSKSSISQVSIALPDIQQLHFRTAELLTRSIISKVIEQLARDPLVSSWVQQGLALHKGERESDECRFCGNDLSPSRRSELEAHFNDAFANFLRDIDQCINDIQRHRQALEGVVFPDASRFYDHLAAGVPSGVEAVKLAIETIDEGLGLLQDALQIRREKPFESIASSGVHRVDDSVGNSLSSALNALNAIVDKHEGTTANLKSEISDACLALEQDYVLEAMPRYDELAQLAKDSDTNLESVSSKPTELDKQIVAIEREIVEHRRPAEELNHELRAYLGRDELKFDVKDSGYTLTRAGQPALHLSEGERTAIAFLYFLKSLEDKSFDLKKGIVVIDDPVSSLDANALFSAFGYMKERTKTCNQLIILTHNFSFFRQVKNWFHHLKGQGKKDVIQRPARFYALLSVMTNAERSATLTTIDRLLEEFESEYHFLFKQVHVVANSDINTTGLTQFYGMPNISRRLVETFLAYRFPDCSGDLIKRIDRVDFDAAKKTRILRLLNTYSHSTGISDPEHDPTVLAETRDVMKVILELMESVDKEHYQGMVKLMAPLEVDE